MLAQLPLKRLMPVMILVIAAILFGLLLTTRPQPARAQHQERIWTVDAETLAWTQVKPQLQLLGQVESPFHSQLTAAITADVRSIPVLEGDLVTRGDVMVELDNQEAMLVYRQRETEVEELAAQVDAEKRRQETETTSIVNEEKLEALAERAVERLEQLKARELASQASIDAAEDALQRQALALNLRRFIVDEHPMRLRQLKARLARADALLARAHLDLSRTRITAPFNGQVTAMQVSPGDRVRPGDHILEIYDTDRLEVRAQLPERWLGRIRSVVNAGHRLEARGTLFGQPFTMELDRIAGRANPGAGGADALFTVTTGAEHLLIDKSVDITLNLPDQHQALTLPLSAIYGTNRVYVIEGERLQAKEVTITGQFFTEKGEQRVIITNPELQPGMQILITQLPRAISGLRVAIRSASS